MESWAVLPQHPLQPCRRIGAQFLARGYRDFRAAARYVGLLPYGRNSNRSDFRLVLPEQRGTCSTKHALLATLAGELRLPLQLRLGIYEMSEENTPGVGPILDAHELACIPEAHCYLIYNGRRIDVTRSSVTPAAPVAHFLHEERISPEQIGAYKTDVHRRFIREWAATGAGLPLSWHELWKVREQCIAALDETG